MTYGGRLGILFVLLRYLEQLQSLRREIHAPMETDSYRKLKDRRTLLLHYLRQHNRSLTGEDIPVSGGRESGKVWEYAIVDRRGPKDAGRPAGSDIRIERIRYRGVRACSDAFVPGRATGGV